MRRPNILMVMTDQMAAPVLPFHGGKVARAPPLEALAERGLLSEAAYTASPLCAPARFSMMAGQRAASIGAFDNAAEFRSEIPTFAHYLRGAGYRTCLAGKMHFVGADQLHGFEERVTTDIYPADFGWTPDWRLPQERIDWWDHNMTSVLQPGIAEITNQYMEYVELMKDLRLELAAEYLVMAALLAEIKSRMPLPRPTATARRVRSDRLLSRLSRPSVAYRVNASQRVRTYRVASPSGDRVTLSIGVAATIPSSHSSPDTLVAAADAQLYQAKLAGRNRVRAAPCLECDPRV